MPQPRISPTRRLRLPSRPSSPSAARTVCSPSPTPAPEIGFPWCWMMFASFAAFPVYGWFPNVAFHDKATPAKKYTLDFWLMPHGDKLKLMDVRIHKAPKPDGTLVDERDACAARLVVAADDEARQRCRRPAGLASHGGDPHAHRRSRSRTASSRSAMRPGSVISRRARRRASAGGNVKDGCQVLCLCRFSQVGK